MTAPDWTQDVRRIACAPGTSSNGNANTLGVAAKVDFNWNAGDVAWVLPMNSQVSVQTLLKLYGLASEDLLDISAIGAANQATRSSFEGQVTAGEMFGRVLGIEVRISRLCAYGHEIYGWLE
jgi:sulfite reductase alpha subunit-like flavoprotein